MLPRGARLRRSSDFSRVVRRGRRAGGRALVVHAVHPSDGPGGAQVGFVVGRSVGGAVERNVVRRRLRHVMADRLDRLDDVDVVVRALPASAGLPSTELAAEVDRLLGRLALPRRAAGAAPGAVDRVARRVP